MIEAGFGYFMERSDSITKDRVMAHTHVKNTKACGCGTLDIFLYVVNGVIVEAGFNGSLSVPNQVLMNDICCRIEGNSIRAVLLMNFAGELSYRLPPVYQKCFHNFIIRTLVLLLIDIREESSTDNPVA